MIENPFPNRAEINDIYNTLIDGVDGLVLAAETAMESFQLSLPQLLKESSNLLKSHLKKNL